MSVGSCPVCGAFGPVLVLVRVTDDRLVYFCPGCETAWREPPTFPVLESVDTLEAIAPMGVRLPTQPETTKLRNVTVVDYEPWKEELDRILRHVS